MHKLYCYQIPLSDGYINSDLFETIEDCIAACKSRCEKLNVDYNDREVKLFLTEDFGETYEECTEKGELAG